LGLLTAGVVLLGISRMRKRNVKRRRALLEKMGISDNQVVPGTDKKPPSKSSVKTLVGFFHPYWYVPQLGQPMCNADWIVIQVEEVNVSCGPLSPTCNEHSQTSYRWSTPVTSPLKRAKQIRPESLVMSRSDTFSRDNTDIRADHIRLASPFSWILRHSTLSLFLLVISSRMGTTSVSPFSPSHSVASTSRGKGCAVEKVSGEISSWVSPSVIWRISFTLLICPDSMGYAFTFPFARLIAGPSLTTGAYVHYPTVSTDMVKRVRARETGIEDGGASNSWLKRQIKLV
jgi:hypothetical protein